MFIRNTSGLLYFLLSFLSRRKKTASNLDDMIHKSCGLRNLGGFSKEVFVGDQVPALSQAMSCSGREMDRKGKGGEI